MKRIFCLLLLLCCLPLDAAFGAEHDINTKNPTYEYILMRKGHDLSKITSYHILKKDFSEILSILLGQEISVSHLTESGYIYGRDLVEVLEKLKLDTNWAKNNSPFLNRVLTFPSFFELLDYVFADIIAIHGFTYESGNLNGSDIYIPKREIFSIEEYSPVKKNVSVVFDGNTIVELILDELHSASYGELTHKTEISGRLYYYEEQEHYLILDLGNRSLKKYNTLQNVHFLGQRDYRMSRNEMLGDKEIYCYVGNYKKYLNLIAIAVERIDY